MARSSRTPAFAGLVLAVALPGLAAAQVPDTDFDGVSDAGDAFPCDWRRAAASFVPSESEFATTMFEDNWPARGDLDFNDAVVLHNFALFRDPSGAVTGLRAVIVPRALGASIESGIALRLPLPAGAARSVVRTIGAGAPASIPLAPGESQLVIPLVQNLRSLWSGARGHVNTDPNLPSAGDGDVVIVEIDFVQPLALSAGAPFDLFFFRSDDPTHQIHRPEFAGTDTMQSALFRTANDGSSALRSFVDTSGLPFVLVIPEQSRWPLELGRVDGLWPSIIGFAASAGAEGRDFYARNVQTSLAYALPPAAIVPSVSYSACVAPSCSDGVQNGQETGVDCGAGCGGCDAGGGCDVNDDCASGVCIGSSCVDSDQRSCTVMNGSGVEQRSGASWGPCQATSCSAGFHVESGACVANARACTVDNGEGSQQWSGGSWGACAPTSCASGFRMSGGACTRITHSWTSGSWGTCGSASAQPSYGEWSTCVGGSGAWSYSAWGACSADEVCEGAGTETRTAECAFTSGSGSMTRPATCTWIASSGTQSRTNTCVNNFGETVSAALCGDPAPQASQPCTPLGVPSGCGTLATAQACTPTSNSVCGTAATSRACASPSGTRACTITNGTGSQSCASGSATWSTCAATSCESGYVLRNGVCNPPACDDGLRNGNEQNVDCGGSCRSCLEAVTDTVSVDEGEQVVIAAATLLANDYAVPQGGAATITVVDLAVGGTVSLSGTTITFRSTGVSGQPASFRYIIQNTVGYVSSVTVNVNVTLPVIEALMVDNVTDLNTLTSAGSGYVPPTALQMFNTWARFSHSGTTRPPANTTEQNSWRYLAATDTVESTVNSGTYIGFVSPDALSNYTMETTLSASNASGDNDAISVIVAFVAEGVPGTATYREHTISAIRNRPAAGDTHTAVGSANTVVRWGLVYNYNQGDERVLANSAALTSATTTWNGTTTRTRVRIERRGDVITAYASNFGTDTIVAGSAITVNLSSAPDLARFSGPRPYGFGALSQANAVFTNRVFSGGLNASVIHDASGTTGRVLDYNATTGAWTVRAGATPQSVLGCPRQVRRPAVTTVTPNLPLQNFYMTCASVTRM